MTGVACLGYGWPHTTHHSTKMKDPRPVAQCQQFPEEAKDASVSECTWTLSTLEALRNALYKFKTYLLTYLHCLLINVFLSFFLIWGDTCSLRMPALRPASQAGPMRNPREGTSVVARHHQANLMVCVMCSCWATSPYREVCRAKEGSAVERPCATIFTLLGL